MPPNFVGQSELISCQPVEPTQQEKGSPSSLKIIEQRMDVETLEIIDRSRDLTAEPSSSSVHVGCQSNSVSKSMTGWRK